MQRRPGRDGVFPIECFCSHEGGYERLALWALARSLPVNHTASNSMWPLVLPAPFFEDKQTSPPVAVLPNDVISSPYRACHRAMPPYVFSGSCNRYSVELRCPNVVP